VPSEYARGVLDGPDGRSLPEVIAETIAGECPSVTRFRRYRVTTMETATEPARGVWEIDRRLSSAANALRRTADHATGPAAATGKSIDDAWPGRGLIGRRLAATSAPGPAVARMCVAYEFVAL
jgi:hypothetical protein